MSHLKSFAEHMFPFLTTKQVDNYLLSIQPPQGRKVSGKKIQSDTKLCRDVKL